MQIMCLCMLGCDALSKGFSSLQLRQKICSNNCKKCAANRLLNEKRIIDVYFIFTTQMSNVYYCEI
jgi:hypothetical protein